LTSALDGGELSASRLSRFTPRERAPGTHWIGTCVDPRAGVDAVVKKKTKKKKKIKEVENEKEKRKKTTKEAKLNLSLCLTKYHNTKTYPVLN
jgi:hypothetical protein